MSRTPTTTDTTVEWEEKVTDPDSDQLTITLVLDAVDDGSGFTNDGTDSSNLSWLSFSEDKSTLADGTTEVLVNIVADKSGLDQGYSYRFRITANDGTTAVDRTFTLSIEKPPVNTLLWAIIGSYVDVRNGDGTEDQRIYTTNGAFSLDTFDGADHFFAVTERSPLTIKKVKWSDFSEVWSVSDISGSIVYQGAGLTYNPNNEYLYICDLNNSQVIVLDGSDGSEINRASISKDPATLDYIRDGSGNVLIRGESGFLEANADISSIINSGRPDPFPYSYSMADGEMECISGRDVIYAVPDGSNNGVYRQDVDNLSGSPKWSYTGGARLHACSVDPDENYVYTKGDERHVAKVDISDGSSVWTNSTQYIIGYNALRTAFIDGQFICPGDNTQVWSFNADGTVNYTKTTSDNGNPVSIIASRK